MLNDSKHQQIPQPLCGGSSAHSPVGLGCHAVRVAAATSPIDVSAFPGSEQLGSSDRWESGWVGSLVGWVGNLPVSLCHCHVTVMLPVSL